MSIIFFLNLFFRSLGTSHNIYLTHPSIRLCKVLMPPPPHPLIDTQFSKAPLFTLLVTTNLPFVTPESYVIPKISFPSPKVIRNYTHEFFNFSPQRKDSHAPRQHSPPLAVHLTEVLTWTLRCTAHSSIVDITVRSAHSWTMRPGVGARKVKLTSVRFPCLAF